MSTKTRTSLRVAAVGFFFAFLFVAACLAPSGCAPGTAGVRQTYGNIAILDAAGYKALDALDVVKQNEIRAEIVKSPVVAEGDHINWMKTRSAARKVLNVAQDTIETTAKLCDDVDAGLKKLPSSSVVIAELLALAPPVLAALADLGIKLPASLTSFLGGGK